VEEDKLIEVDVEPGGRVVKVRSGTTLAAAAGLAGLEVELPCGGKGRCCKCAVEAEGLLSAPSPVEKSALRRGLLKEGTRLMCQAKVLGKAAVRVPETALSASAQIMEEGGVQGAWALDPNVRSVVLDLAPPGMEDQAGDRERLERALRKAGAAGPAFDLPVLRDLGQKLRDGSFRCAVTLVGNEVVDVRPPPGGRTLGMAFDIGTTTVVGYLIDLASGRELAVASALNPQVRHGFDVISRIVYGIERPDGVEVLSRLIRDLMGRLMSEACLRADVSSRDVYEVCIAGNTTMTHLFLGIDPHYLALAPYVPVTTGAITAKASSLGLPMHPGGSVYVLPGIGSFIGADTTGVILSTRFDEDRGPGLAIDIGTNGEIVGRDGSGRLFALSTAAGPAFEGSKISSGLRGMRGAIEHVSASGSGLSVRTIGGVDPVGICGSGLVDALAVMRRAGVLDETGRLAGPDKKSPGRALSRRVVRGPSGPEFVLAKGGRNRTPVAVTQRDIRELQLAKGAITAGVKIMLARMGADEGDLTEVLLAGAFGNYIDKANARAIGLLPNLSLDLIKAVGNAAGEGARAALLSGKARRGAEATVRRVTVINLAHAGDFQKRFLEGMSLKEA
jgi:uncharacterized 2Fe-2S/4Fe-4S cluster protein (DUF4445 family)